MIHQVRTLPKEGEYVRTKCGRMVDDPSTVALKKDDAPEGAEFCRGACWRKGTTNPARIKVLQLEDLLRSNPGLYIPAEDLRAILEDRYYPEENRSPKAA